MERHYIQLRDILSGIDGIITIDEDTGQLEAMLNGEDTYPIAFPAVLIAFGDTEWQSYVGRGVQRGTGTVIVRTAFDCYDDSHQGAGQDSYINGRMEKVGEIHRAVQGVPSAVSGRPFNRIRSRTVTLPGRIKVYEQEYTYTTEE